MNEIEHLFKDQKSSAFYTDLPRTHSSRQAKIKAAQVTKRLLENSDNSRKRKRSENWTSSSSSSSEEEEGEEPVVLKKGRGQSLKRLETSWSDGAAGQRPDLNDDGISDGDYRSGGRRLGRPNKGRKADQGKQLVPIYGPHGEEPTQRLAVPETVAALAVDRRGRALQPVVAGRADVRLVGELVRLLERRGHGGFEPGRSLTRYRCDVCAARGRRLVRLSVEEMRRHLVLRHPAETTHRCKVSSCRSAVLNEAHSIRQHYWQLHGQELVFDAGRRLVLTWPDGCQEPIKCGYSRIGPFVGENDVPVGWSDSDDTARQTSHVDHQTADTNQQAPDSGQQAPAHGAAAVAAGKSVDDGPSQVDGQSAEADLAVAPSASDAEAGSAGSALESALESASQLTSESASELACQPSSSLSASSGVSTWTSQVPDESAETTSSSQPAGQSWTKASRQKAVSFRWSDVADSSTTAVEPFSYSYGQFVLALRPSGGCRPTASYGPELGRLVRAQRLKLADLSDDVVERKLRGLIDLLETADTARTTADQPVATIPLASFADGPSLDAKRNTCFKLYSRALETVFKVKVPDHRPVVLPPSTTLARRDPNVRLAPSPRSMAPVATRPASSAGLPSTGLPSAGLPSTGLPSAGLPSTSLPSTRLASTCQAGPPANGRQTNPVPTAGYSMARGHLVGYPYDQVSVGRVGGRLESPTVVAGAQPTGLLNGPAPAQSRSGAAVYAGLPGAGLGRYATPTWAAAGWDYAGAVDRTVYEPLHNGAGRPALP